MGRLEKRRRTNGWRVKLPMHFVIIGNGVAGATAAMTLRQREPEAEITMISGESDYFFSRTALMYAYMDRMSRRDLEPFERKAYTRQNIRLVRDWVTDLDAAGRILHLKTGQPLVYDRLLLAVGSLANRPAWPGLESARQGVVHFVTLQDLEQCERYTNSTREAVVVGGGLIGVELAECLHFHGKEVTFMVRSPGYWPAALGKEESEIVTGHIRRHGVCVRPNDEPGEVLVADDGRVRGLRCKSGAELPCQMLGIAIGVHPAVDWLQKVTTPPRIERGIVISPSLETSLENVWAAGDCAEFEHNGQWTLEQIWYTAKRQGELAARAMLGDAIRYEPPIFYNSAMFFEIEYTSSGMVNDAPPGAISFFCRIPGKEASVRIVELEDAVVGLNMLGARWNHTIFERWIAERRTMDYVVEHLAEAQFDVEFGRVDISSVAPSYRLWKGQAARAVGAD
jgi:NAD(P)H-nitrite reductase large subunit